MARLQGGVLCTIDSLQKFEPMLRRKEFNDEAPAFGIMQCHGVGTMNVDIFGRHVEFTKIRK